jgi:hypothetical protein
MKKLFRGEYVSVFEYLLHLGPWVSFWLLNFIAATLVAMAMAALIWWQKH